MRSPLAESQRAALIEATLPDVAFDGWSRPALRAPSARCVRTCAAVRNVLRVRMMPSATLPHTAMPFWNTAER